MAVALDVRPFRTVAEGRIVGDVRQDAPVAPGEHGQELGRRADLPVGIDMVGLRVSDDLVASVDRAVRRAHRDFGDAVAVKVEHHERVVVLSGPDVLSGRQAPEPPLRAQVVAVVEDGRRPPELRVVPAQRAPLDHQFEFAVAVKVADGAVVCQVGVGLVLRLVGISPRRRRSDLERDVADWRGRWNLPAARRVL